MRAGLAGGPEMTLSRFMQVVQQRDNKSIGAIRVSLGLATNFSDVYHFIQFAVRFRDQTTLSIGPVTFDIDRLPSRRRSAWPAKPPAFRPGRSSASTR
jgi:hypothetical protein